MLVKQLQLGKEANFATLLINYYKALVSTLRFDAISQIKKELIFILENDFNASPKDCELLGDRYRRKKDYIPAILFYQVAEALHKQKSDSDEIINCLQGCALGLKIAIGDLLKLRPDLRPIVTSEIVPAMRRIYNKLSGMHCSRITKMILIRSLCLHHIETTELISEDNTVREKTLREAVALMKGAFKEDASKYHLYSAHLNNLAVVCMTKERPEEAIEIFEEAIVSRKRATDYTTRFEREQDLHASVDGLRKAREMLEYMQKASTSAET